MGKSLIIKGADFSDSAVEIYKALGNLVYGFLSNAGTIQEEGAALLCVTSEDYVDLTDTKYIYYDNSVHKAGICLYDASKTFIKRLLIETKESTPSSVDITQISGYETARFARISVANEFAGGSQLTIEEMQGNILASDIPLVFG